MSDRRKIETVCRRLMPLHGPVKPPPRGPVLDELVLTILSQHTSDTNSDAAFDDLQRAFPDWDAVRRASVEQLAAAIRRAGLSRQKAPRIKAILDKLHTDRGRLSLDFLRRWPVAKALDYLRAMPGVGPKTAACVLLFACRQPVLPVDTHVHRVSGRLGLIGSHTDAATAHEELAALVPPARVLDFHILLIRHGRTTCTARKPRCEHCPLLDLCPAGFRQMRAAERPKTALGRPRRDR
jgi:endonuclease-3